MSKLIIRRQMAAWQDRVRNYRVVIDGEAAGEIANGDAIEVPIEPGKHQVQMKIDWCQSPMLEIHVGMDETQMLECGPNATPVLAILYVTIFRHKYLWLRPAEKAP